MAVLLLILGLVTSLAGLLLVASGVNTHDGTFDPEMLTPGMIGLVGGFLLIGLEIAVRQLRRIERSLAAAPVSAPRVSEIAVANPPQPVPAPVALVPKAEAPANEARDAAAAPVVDEAALDRLRAKFPTLAGRQIGPAVQAALSSAGSAPQVRVAVEDAVAAEVKGATVVTARAANGGGRPSPAPARLDAKPTPTPRTNGSGLSSFWPAGPRRDERKVSPQPHSDLPLPGQVAEMSTAKELPPSASQADQPVPSNMPVPEATPVTALKSGVVEGMAYTLYSDGSIEAQLPQGTLRFGSIGALRNHIEGAAQ